MSETDPTQQFSVTAEGETSSRTTVSVRDFEFVVDEPTAVGGTNEGPTPVEYLLGAWAGCLNLTAHNVAADRGVEIEGIELGLEGDLDPRKFAHGSDGARAGFQEIRVEVKLAADGDDEALDGFAAEVEERCPVGDNLQNATPAAVSVDLR
ncbi:OsmC family protein [Haloparvum alkalitolerans]|uniref:OsmC family protein n=1 Tax=Haloparvum alkalitolerans TaxID=1042953 RepID=UPI003CF2F1A9